MDIDLGTESCGEQMATTKCIADDSGSKLVCGEAKVLATLLVCDWNVRAWTSLEAMRGRGNTHVLCKNQKILSIKDTIQKILFCGRIDLIILFLTSHHLLPGDPFYSSSRDESRGNSQWKATDGSVVEDVTCHLNHRYASRQGDEMVIWSLLCGTQIYDSAEAIWKARIGLVLHTGFLLSSAPRLQDCLGFRWAPSRPTIQPYSAVDDSSGMKLYPATDGSGSMIGRITRCGFEANWLICEWDASSRKVPLKAWMLLNPDLRDMPSFRKVAEKHLCRFRTVALLEAIQEGSYDKPALYRDDADTPVYAIVASIDGKNWEWQGVYKWVTSDRLPTFIYKKKLLLV